jgi:hypothetical protein
MDGSTITLIELAFVYGAALWFVVSQLRALRRYDRKVEPDRTNTTPDEPRSQTVARHPER